MLAIALQKIVDTTKSSLDEAKEIAEEKVQLDPTQTICEYFRSEDMSSEIEYTVQCTTDPPIGEGSHWKQCDAFGDSSSDIVMDEEQYVHEIVVADHSSALQSGSLFQLAF